MPTFNHDNIDFNYADSNFDGIEFVFQHGLNGNVDQIFSLFTPPKGYRMLCLDCRGHGKTRPLGDKNKLSISDFSQDILALLEFLSIKKVIIGGISMGAAIALTFSLKFSEYVAGLVLSRPAWLEGPMLSNASIYKNIAQLLHDYGPEKGKKLFKKTEQYLDILNLSPDSATSLLGHFEHTRPDETIVKLEQIAKDYPPIKLERLKSIAVPTLVLGNHKDPIHPFEYGKTISDLIPNAIFREITPKSEDKHQHQQDVQTYITEFLEQIR